MSRVGKVPILVPSGVSVFLDTKNSKISVEGKHGKMDFAIAHMLSCEYLQVSTNKEEVAGKIIFRVKDAFLTSIEARARWGLTRSIVSNMVLGVHSGFTKSLEIVGVGYKASVDNNFLTLYLGHSHDIVYAVPPGIVIKCEKPTSISVFGYDKELVGRVASEIRSLRKPEPYKGKGIRYSDEVVIRKEGKKK